MPAELRQMFLIECRKEYIPFSKGVKRFVGCFGDNRYLVTSNRVDKTPTFYDGFGTHENAIDLLHNVRHGGVQEDSTWNTSSGELLASFNSDDQDSYVKGCGVVL